MRKTHKIPFRTSVVPSKAAPAVTSHRELWDEVVEDLPRLVCQVTYDASLCDAVWSPAERLRGDNWLNYFRIADQPDWEAMRTEPWP